MSNPTIPAGAKAISNNIILGEQSTVASNSLYNLTIVSGKTPSQDAIEKETGVKNIINNFGKPVEKTTEQILSLMDKPRNTGIDSLKVGLAASILNPISTSTEQPVSKGQTKITDATVSSEFGKSLGTAAALAIKEGVVENVATFVDEISSDSIDANTVVNKLPNDYYQLTNKGATVMNSMRSPSSALGVRKKITQWENYDLVNNNKRLLNAETGNDTNT